MPVSFCNFFHHIGGTDDCLDNICGIGSLCRKETSQQNCSSPNRRCLCSKPESLLLYRRCVPKRGLRLLLCRHLCSREHQDQPALSVSSLSGLSLISEGTSGPCSDCGGWKISGPASMRSHRIIGSCTLADSLLKHSRQRWR